MATITSPGYAPARAASPIRLTARGRRVLMAVVTLPLALALLAGATRTASAADRRPLVSTVVVQPGQTLWQIAETIAPAQDPRATVYQIEQLNGMATAHVDAGTLLVVPAAGS